MPLCVYLIVNLEGLSVQWEEEGTSYKQQHNHEGEVRGVDFNDGK